MNWDILLKYVNKESTVAESNMVQTWLNENKDNKNLLFYLQRRSELLQEPLKKNDIQTEWVLLLDRIFETGSTENKPHKPNAGLWFIGIAASLLVFSLLGRFYLSPANYVSNSKVISLQTPLNKRGRVVLPDGSTVYLAPASKLTYTNTFGLNKRELRLTGEAFFDVKHNVKKPFIINTSNNLSVTVLGTSFNIYSRNGKNTEVKVATGLVGINANKLTQFLKAGQQLRYLQNKQFVIMPVEHNDAAALQIQTLFFKNDNADAIAEKLHRWYNVNVEVSPTAKKHPHFTGEMKDAGIDNLMKGLSYATGLKYRYKHTHTILLY